MHPQWNAQKAPRPYQNPPKTVPKPSQDPPKTFPKSLKNLNFIENVKFAFLGPILDGQMVPQTSPRPSQNEAKIKEISMEKRCEKKLVFSKRCVWIFHDFRPRNPGFFESNFDAFCNKVKNCKSQQNTAWAHKF